MSKNPKPTIEELRRVYDLILRGYDDADILAEYASLYENGNLMFPYRTDKRFIKECRRELAAAEEVLKEHVKRQVDPVIAEQRKKHNRDLTKMAKLLLANDLDLIIHIEDQLEDGDFYGWLYDNEKYVISSKEELTKLLWRNVDDANEKFRPLDMFSSFEEHFDHESTSGRGFKVLARTEPFELIQLLKLLAQRGIFKSRCEICRGWY